MDQGLIAQLKEQYRKERRGKKGVKSKSSSSSATTGFWRTGPVRPVRGQRVHSAEPLLMVDGWTHRG